MIYENSSDMNVFSVVYQNVYCCYSRRNLTQEEDTNFSADVAIYYLRRFPRISQLTWRFITSDGFPSSLDSINGYQKLYDQE